MRAEIELLQNASIARVEQHDIVGKIVGNQQPVASLARNHGQSGRIWDRSSRRCLAHSEGHLLAVSNVLRRDLDETFGTHFAVFKFVNRDAVAGVAWLRARGVGNGTDRSIEMSAIGTESQAEEVALMGAFREARVGKIRQLVVT